MSAHDRLPPADARMVGTLRFQRIAPGEYAYLDDADRYWYRVNDFDLDELEGLLEDDPRDGYSIWCQHFGERLAEREIVRLGLES